LRVVVLSSLGVFIVTHLPRPAAVAMVLCDSRQQQQQQSWTPTHSDKAVAERHESGVALVLVCVFEWFHQVGGRWCMGAPCFLVGCTMALLVEL
jgi:hypothetical protein